MTLIDLGPEFGAGITPETAARLESVAVRDFDYGDHKGLSRVVISFTARAYEGDGFITRTVIDRPREIESTPMKRDEAMTLHTKTLEVFRGLAD